MALQLCDLVHTASSSKWYLQARTLSIAKDGYFFLTFDYLPILCRPRQRACHAVREELGGMRTLWSVDFEDCSTEAPYTRQ